MTRGAKIAAAFQRCRHCGGLVKQTRGRGRLRHHCDQRCKQATDRRRRQASRLEREAQDLQRLGPLLRARGVTDVRMMQSVDSLRRRAADLRRPAWESDAPAFRQSLTAAGLRVEGPGTGAQDR